MSDINAEFYMLKYSNSKKWNSNYADIPKNHFFLHENVIPPYFEYDFVLSQSKYSQYELALKLAKDRNIPLVCLEHTLPTSNFTAEQIGALKTFVGNYNVYISEYNKKAWGADGVVIPHCVDPIFEYKEDHENNVILSVQNDYVNRDYCLGYYFYKQSTKDLPTVLVGDTPGLSQSAKNTQELINYYQRSAIYYNTAHESPIPSSLLEAMSCGCACVSVKTCAIPDYIEHEENGFLVSSPEEARYYLDLLLKNKKLRQKFGAAARKTIEEKCNKDVFTKNWDLFIKRIT